MQKFGARTLESSVAVWGFIRDWFLLALLISYPRKISIVISKIFDWVKIMGFAWKNIRAVDKHRIQILMFHFFYKLKAKPYVNLEVVYLWCEPNWNFRSEHLQRRFGARACGLSPSLLSGPNNSGSNAPCSQRKLFMTKPFVKGIVQGTVNYSAKL